MCVGVDADACIFGLSFEESLYLGDQPNLNLWKIRIARISHELVDFGEIQSEIHSEI